jgi:hypothetical protein
VCPNTSIETVSTTSPPTSITVNEAPTLDWGTGDFALAMVVKASNAGGSVPFWSGNGVSLGMSPGSAMTGEFTLQAGSESVMATGSASTFQVVIARGEALDLIVGS